MVSRLGLQEEWLLLRDIAPTYRYFHHLTAVEPLQPRQLVT